MFNSLLPIFVCVADCGSFNKAAEKMYISPPAIMKQINALEKHLDMKLFDRTNQGIRLTPAGKV
ncbi:MAG: LysR family transcriptional regulator, partial [Candidatus Pseudoruminococcus sp.]|nr:LysR family transcriptional regulator [Candidatus Pseudoruminococcus sp.]